MCFAADRHHLFVRALSRRLSWSWKVVKLSYLLLWQKKKKKLIASEENNYARTWLLIRRRHAIQCGTATWVWFPAFVMEVWLSGWGLLKPQCVDLVKYWLLVVVLKMKMADSCATEGCCNINMEQEVTGSVFLFILYVILRCPENSGQQTQAVLFFMFIHNCTVSVFYFCLIFLSLT